MKAIMFYMHALVIAISFLKRRTHVCVLVLGQFYNKENGEALLKHLWALE